LKSGAKPETEIPREAWHAMAQVLSWNNPTRTAASLSFTRYTDAGVAAIAGP
jgi:hypothetical protein